MRQMMLTFKRLYFYWIFIPGGTMKALMSWNFSRIPSLTSALAAFECLKNQLIMFALFFILVVNQDFH